jgi:hypothetical protein
MAGYLDQYGAGEEKRENIIKYGVIGVLSVVIFGSLFYYLFKNHSQESEVKSFVQALRKKDYAGGYKMWGCTDAKPCPGYAYDKFLQDWGPQSPAANAAGLRIVDSESCNAGVILTVDVNSTTQERLWVDKNSPILGFSPVEVCPNKSPLSNMIHHTVGKLRKPFLN